MSKLEGRKTETIRVKKSEEFGVLPLAKALFGLYYDEKLQAINNIDAELEEKGLPGTLENAEQLDLEEIYKGVLILDVLEVEGSPDEFDVQILAGEDEKGTNNRDRVIERLREVVALGMITLVEE